MTHVYAVDEMRQVIKTMEAFFDLARVVDPIKLVTCDMDKSSEKGLHCTPYRCCSTWDKSKRCENCISLQALRENTRKTKYEFIDKDIYYVVAVPITLAQEQLVFEIVSNVTDEVLLGAFGHNEFVEKITRYNIKLHQDSLTGLFNRKYLGEQIFLDNHIPEQRGSIAVAILNIDHFKMINQIESPGFGDQILIKLAQLFIEHIRLHVGDFAVRYDGDEFLLVFKGRNRAEFETEIDRLIRKIGEKLSDITVCVGGASAEEFPGESLETLILHADRRVFSAKQNGRNMVVLSD